jgi:nucleoside-specific outer membrane channel protein Tsx
MTLSRRTPLVTLAVLGSALVALPARAVEENVAGTSTVKAPPPKKLLQWSMFDFQGLYGRNWRLGPARKDILTLEHADGWSRGDNYLFIDVSHIASQENKDTGIYGEWQPRLSFSKIIGKDLSAGIFADVLETNRLAFGSGFLAVLNGIAVDLKLPGFAFFHQHGFLRNDINLPGVTWQLTTEWAVPIEIKALRLVLDGFVHFIGPEGGTHFNIIAQPQLLIDVGNFAHYVDQVFIGTEVDLRYNEFGIKGQNEVVPQAMIEWKL